MTEIERLFEKEKQDAIKEARIDFAKKIMADYTLKQVAEITTLNVLLVMNLYEQQGIPLSDYDEAFREGYKIGVAYVAKNLLKDGMPIEKVAKYANCSLEELKQIIQEWEASPRGGALDQIVRAKTRFASWEEMKETAGSQNVDSILSDKLLHSLASLSKTNKKAIEEVQRVFAEAAPAVE